MDINKILDETTRITGAMEFSPTAFDTDALVHIYPPGPGMGRKYTLDHEVVNLGRDASNQIIVQSDSVSRRHAQLTTRTGQRLITDLQSTNGTYINNQAIVTHILQNGDQLRVGNNIFKYLVGSDVESAYHEEIYTMTIKDGLTAVYNKRYFVEALERELCRAQRHRRKLSVVLFDIDFFKKVNDAHGHLAGDYVLRELAATVDKRSRREEIFARFGGEEFVVLLPESDGQEAGILGERLRALVEEHRFAFDGKEISVTISVGVATIDASRKVSAAELLKAADAQLYRAKTAGRNCVHSEEG